MILKFNVKNQIIKRADTNRIVADSKNYLLAEFCFTDDWVGSKTAIFKYEGEDAVNQLLDDNNRCKVPFECIKSGQLSISCFCGDLITANKSYINIEESGLENGKTPEPPTPDIYSQILEIAKKAKEDAESVIDRANNGDFNGRDGGVGPIGPQGPPGKDGVSDFWKLKNVPFQPVPEPSDPNELLRIPQDLEPGAYVFQEGTHIWFNGESYYPSKGELLYISLPYPFKNKSAVIYDGDGVKFTNKDTGGYVTIDSSLLNEFEQIYQMFNLLSEWLVPLFNVSPGQAVTVENADMANMQLELGGMDLPTALPSPNALTIKIGSETVVYDGSSAQTIEIADGNEVAY